MRLNPGSRNAPKCADYSLFVEWGRDGHLVESAGIGEKEQSGGLF